MMSLYQPPLKNTLLGCVKTPGLEYRKASCIKLIQRALRSSNRGSFHVSPKVYFSAEAGISHYLEICLFKTFSAFFNAASWPTYPSMSYEAALKTAKKTFKNSILQIVR